MRARLLLIILVAACSGPGEPAGTSAGPEPDTTIESPTTTLGVTTTLEPTTTIAADAAPPELRGIWETELNAEETLVLTLRGTTYQANIQGSPETGTGRISVEGDTIEFFGSDRCPGDPGGTYTWVVEDENLTFTPVGEDPCGRNGFIPGQTYTLLSELP